MVVVSGGALGIDAMAHQQALNQSCKTVAVLAQSDKMTPTTNQPLFDQMIESGIGSVITECPPEQFLSHIIFSTKLVDRHDDK